MDGSQDRHAPATREELRLRWPSATPRERRAMMRGVSEHERHTPEGAARDRKRKAIFYTLVFLIVAGGFVHRIVTQ